MSDDRDAWTRPDMGVEPEDYVEGGGDEGEGGEPKAPAEGLVGDEGTDVPEPNEPG